MWRLFRGTFRPEESLCSLCSTRPSKYNKKQTTSKKFYTVNPKPNVPQLSLPATREASGDVSRSLLLGSELIPQTFYPLYTFYTVNPKPLQPLKPAPREASGVVRRSLLLGSELNPTHSTRPLKNPLFDPQKRGFSDPQKGGF